jgi:hypothetical protein
MDPMIKHQWLLWRPGTSMLLESLVCFSSSFPLFHVPLPSLSSLSLLLIIIFSPSKWGLLAGNQRPSPFCFWPSLPRCCFGLCSPVPGKWRLRYPRSALDCKWFVHFLRTLPFPFPSLFFLLDYIGWRNGFLKYSYCLSSKWIWEIAVIFLIVGVRFPGIPLWNFFSIIAICLAHIFLWRLRVR